MEVINLVRWHHVTGKILNHLFLIHLIHFVEWLRPASIIYIISVNFSHPEQLAQVVYTPIGPVSVITFADELRIAHFLRSSNLKSIILSLNHATVKISWEFSCAWPERWRLRRFARLVREKQLVDSVTILNLVRLLVNCLISCYATLGVLRRCTWDKRKDLQVLILLFAPAHVLFLLKWSLIIYLYLLLELFEKLLRITFFRVWSQVLTLIDACFGQIALFILDLM